MTHCLGRGMARVSHCVVGAERWRQPDGANLDQLAAQLTGAEEAQLAGAEETQLANEARLQPASGLAAAD